MTALYLARIPGEPAAPAGTALWGGGAPGVGWRTAGGAPQPGPAQAVQAPVPSQPLARPVQARLSPRDIVQSGQAYDGLTDALRQWLGAVT